MFLISKCFWLFLLINRFSETSMTAAKSVLVKLNAVQVFISIFLGYFILQVSDFRYIKTMLAKRINSLYTNFTHCPCEMCILYTIVCTWDFRTVLNYIFWKIFNRLCWFYYLLIFRYDYMFNQQTTEGVQRTIFGTLFLIVNCKYYIYCWCSQQLLKAVRSTTFFFIIVVK